MKTEYQIYIDSIKGDVEQLKSLAEELNTSVNYLTGHLYRPTREPALCLAYRLSEETGISMKSLYDHFRPISKSCIQPERGGQ